MKKFNYLYLAGIACLASCSSDEFIGEQGYLEQEGNGEINFSMKVPNMTRAGANITGATAAEKLGKRFYVLGTKGTLPTTSTTTGLVFNNYKVVWEENSAGKTEDNTNDWKYVGETAPDLTVTGGTPPTSQTIKYWDYSADQYDFIAYSVGENTLVTTGSATDGNILGSAIEKPTTSAPTSFTLTGATVDDLAECYYTDVITVEKGTNGANYNKPVQLVFKNLTARVRVAFYETIPGYSVSGLEFYANTTDPLAAEKSTDATLFTTGSDVLAKSGSITVSYPTVGKTEKDKSPQSPNYNKASVSVNTNGTDTKTSQTFGTVNYGTGSKLGTTSKEASMAGNSTDSYYQPVLPGNGHPLTLRVNYTLTSEDGSGETIKVYGATAVVPSSYTTWKQNSAYTYIFKISDNTNGYTSTSTTDPSGLYPITFDAVVAAVDDVDFNQETITTVASSSVTTYAFNSSTKKVIAAYGATGNEYPAAATTDIYVSVQDVADLSSGVLYTVSGVTTPLEGTEAEVIDALQMGTDASGTITGRNGIVLIPASTAAATNVTSIPTEDGNGITVAAKSVAKFTATTTPTTYAYVYKTASGTASYIYTAETLTAVPSDWTTNWYTDNTGTTQVTAWVDATHKDKTWYHKITNNNNTYAVKVIKTY